MPLGREKNDFKFILIKMITVCVGGGGGGGERRSNAEKGELTFLRLD